MSDVLNVLEKINNGDAGDDFIASCASDPDDIVRVHQFNGSVFIDVSQSEAAIQLANDDVERLHFWLVKYLALNAPINAAGD